MSKQPNLYEDDFYAWTIQQTQLIKDNLIGELDFIHLQEELISLTVSEESLLKQQIRDLLTQFLILKYCQGQNDKSVIRIKLHRHYLMRTLEECPSLINLVNKALIAVYKMAILYASLETNVDE